MTIQAGDLWVADIPFTDGSAFKKRPVLVLWLDRLDVVVATVTSAAVRTPTDVPLLDWQAAGLRVASCVRLFRLDCLELLAGVSARRLVSDGRPADQDRLGCSGEAPILISTPYNLRMEADVHLARRRP